MNISKQCYFMSLKKTVELLNIWALHLSWLSFYNPQSCFVSVLPQRVTMLSTVLPTIFTSTTAKWNARWGQAVAFTMLWYLPRACYATITVATVTLCLMTSVQSKRTGIWNQAPHCRMSSSMTSGEHLCIRWVLSILIYSKKKKKNIYYKKKTS